MEPTEQPRGGEHPPGWYPNQQGPGYRYWDSSRWTDHYLYPEAPGPRTPRAAGPESFSARRRTRLVLAGFGVLAGIIGLTAALGLPHSEEEVLVSKGVYVREVYYLLILVGSIEAIVFGTLLGGLAILRPAAPSLPPIQAITLVLSVVLVAGTAIVLAGYYATKSDEDETHAASATGVSANTDFRSTTS